MPCVNPLTLIVHAQGRTLTPINITGTDTGQYTADGDQMTVEGLAGGGEAEMGGVALFTTDSQSKGRSYTCEEDVLTVENTRLRPAHVRPHRRDPRPDSVEVETGSPRPKRGNACIVTSSPKHRDSGDD